MSASLLFELLLGAKRGLDGVIRNFFSLFCRILRVVGCCLMKVWQSMIVMLLSFACYGI